MGDVPDGRQQGRVDHRGAGAEQDGSHRPGGEGVRRGDSGQGEALQQHSRDDESLAAPPVGQGAGRELAQAPDRGVERGEYADSRDRQSGAGEQHREQPPGEPVVEVVDQPGLAGRGQGWFVKAGLGEDLPLAELCVQVRVPSVCPPAVLRRLELGVATGLLHRQGR